MNYYAKRNIQAGVSLLEVLVALFVLAVGLLGVIALQAETIKLNQQAYGSTQAIFAANDGAERLRLNLAAYVDALPSEQKLAPLTPALTDVLPTAEAEQWQTHVAAAVPGGTGKIEQVNGAGTDFKITITYTFDVLDNQKANANAADAESFEYVLYVSL